MEQLKQYCLCLTGILLIVIEIYYQEIDMSRFIVFLFAMLLIININVFGEDDTDILGMALDSVGFSRADLGYHPKGYWSRFPLDIPYKLTSFDDLFAEPLKLYDFSKTMANSVEKYLDPGFLDSSSLSLYYLTYALGVDRKLGGFRNYSPNLLDITDSLSVVLSAVDSLLAYASRDSVFSSYYEKDNWETTRQAARDLDENFPFETKAVIGRLIVNLTDIIKWRNLAFRNCDPEVMGKIFGIKDLALTQADGNIYYPEIDDIAQKMDYASLHYAALKTAAIVQETAEELSLFRQYAGNAENEYGQSAGLADFSIPTPYGGITLIGFSNNIARTMTFEKSLVLINFGSGTNFTGPAGANSGIDIPVSIFIDLGDDNSFTSGDIPASQGCGILGIGIMYNAYGNDVYTGKENTQGMGFLGVGILFDREGNDKYRAELSGQGCGYFGIGLCIDGGGDDSLYIYGAGQGMGGIGGGVGVLADYSGNDSYIGEPSPEVFDLSDYHSEKKINGNGVQGVGFGRRGDITDGHAWAGGVGAIIDLSGDDHYLSGNWSLGTAYWFATGIAYDGEGDDIYESCYFTQGSGAHFCNGIMIDEGGNDRHELYETAGAALGFGWDYTNAFLINIGGDDSYRAKMISIGCAEIRSNAFLIDIGGNDSYQLKEGALGLGAVDYRDYYFKPTPIVTYYSESKSIGALIDIGGDDRYLSFNDSTETMWKNAGNNKFWFNPVKSDSTYGANNFGIGVDAEKGIIPEIERWK